MSGRPPGSRPLLGGGIVPASSPPGPLPPATRPAPGTALARTDGAALPERSVGDIFSAAERTAAEFQQQVEAQVNAWAVQTRRVAEEEAARIRADAITQAQDYLEQARRQIDGFAQERVDRIAAATDQLIRAAEAVHYRFEEAQAVRRQLGVLVDAMGTAAEEAVRAVHAPDPEVAPPWLAPGASGRADGPGQDPDEVGLPVGDPVAPVDVD